MSKFIVGYGLGGGFGGIQQYVVIEARDLNDANKQAWELACEEYDQYDGMHGLTTVEEFMEEEECDYDTAKQYWEEERESWLDYEAFPHTPEKAKELSESYHYHDRFKQ